MVAWVLALTWSDALFLATLAWIFVALPLVLGAYFRVTHRVAAGIERLRRWMQ